jgi:hypothetical protein
MSVICRGMNDCFLSLAFAFHIRVYACSSERILSRSAPLLVDFVACPSCFDVTSTMLINKLRQCHHVLLMDVRS